MRHRHEPGPQQQPPSILPLVTLLVNHRPAAVTELQRLTGDGTQADMDARRARTRRLRIIVGGTAVAGLPAGSAIGLAIEGRPGGFLVLAIVTVVTAAAAMYEARQETKRTEIECYSANTMAAAAARYIDSTHEVS